MRLMNMLGLAGMRLRLSWLVPELELSTRPSLPGSRPSPFETEFRIVNVESLSLPSEFEIARSIRPIAHRLMISMFRHNRLARENEVERRSPRKPSSIRRSKTARSSKRFWSSSELETRCP